MYMRLFLQSTKKNTKTFLLHVYVAWPFFPSSIVPFILCWACIEEAQKKEQKLATWTKKTISRSRKSQKPHHYLSINNGGKKRRKKKKAVGIKWDREFKEESFFSVCVPWIKWAYEIFSFLPSSQKYVQLQQKKMLSLLMNDSNELRCLFWNGIRKSVCFLLVLLLILTHRRV